MNKNKTKYKKIYLLSVDLLHMFHHLLVAICLVGSDNPIKQVLYKL